MSRPRLKARETSGSSLSTVVGLSSPGGKLLALARRWALYEISQHDWLVWCPADRKYAHVTVWDDQWGLEVGL